jgi:EF-P beta-lysylation protein EpmB
VTVREARLWPSGEWRKILADTVSSLDELLDMVDLDAAELESLELQQRAAAQFPLRVPRTYVSRMVPGDARDPLLLQVLPSAAELEQVEGFSLDPLGEAESRVQLWSLQKYEGRLLVLASSSCAVACRYCFRRHFPHDEASLNEARLEELVAHLETNPEIDEVILSGGDPLLLPDRQLAEIAQRIETVATVRRLRIHSRCPIVIPQRVDEDLVAWMSDLSIPIAVVLHANHPNELDRSVERAGWTLRDAGVLVLNQSVLLAGVNDNVDVLAELSRRLIECGAQPYYLHLLDRVSGAAHFEVGEARARELMAALLEKLPGYLIPRCVRAVRGAGSKVPLCDAKR